MWAYRTCKRRYDPLDTTGAREVGGRWNSPGRGVVYASDSFAGTLLEIIAHAEPRRLPGPHHCSRVEIPPDVGVERLEADDLPGWDDEDLGASRDFGDAWLREKRTVALLVPAVPARPFGRNVLLDPEHPDFSKLVPEDPVAVSWDPRLL